MKKEVPAIYHPSSFLHQPQNEIFNGVKKSHQDIPLRIGAIVQAMQTAGFLDIQVSRSENCLPIVSRVHDQGYLKHLEDTSRYAQEVAKKKEDPDFQIYPSVHPYTPNALAQNGIARRGLYIYDTYTPIMKNTYQVALLSAGVAIAGAMLISEGEPLVYGLTRPSGHHALRSMSGGMCYINNAAAATEYLRIQESKKVAILDIDLHHGNGTQDIFYEDPNVLVVSIHSDPHFTFPYFTGYPEEVGSGPGYGTNRNFPLPQHTGNEQYDRAAGEALTVINNFHPDYLVISAGFDTHEKESVDNFRLTTTYYKKLGEKIKKLDMPVLVLQEGGYAPENLGLNVVAFLGGLIRR